MTKTEFLEGLRAYLEPEVRTDIIWENVNYYNRYISDEVIKGRREEDVIDELGDPWVIAKTIIDMQAEENETETVYEATRDSWESYGNTRTFRFDTWWKKLLLIICFILILVVIFSIITGLISLLIPILVPLILILMVYRFFKSRN